MRVDASEMTRVLTGWLGHQRWYAGKSRSGTVTARLLARLGDDPVTVEIWIADVRYTDDSVEHYQVPVVLRPSPADQLEHAVVGVAGDADDGAPIQIYDALHDKEATAMWLRAIAAGRSTDGVEFVATVPPEEVPVDETSLALTAEQSNTSVVFGDVAIMKTFRRIEPGKNPDVEVHAALTALGARHIARMLGYVAWNQSEDSWGLAMVQEFMTTATDGWQLATGSVRDLMAEGDLHAEEAGGDFAAEAYRLGVSTAEVHADLAQAFGGSELGPDELRRRAQAMGQRLDQALEEVPALRDVADGLRAAYADFERYPHPVAVQRVHGDLHLGQVLRTVRRWIFLDFEGEPAKPIEQRREADSPIRDVAGMLRSFDYAARHQLIDVGATHQSEFRAAEWADRNRAAFTAGYQEGGGIQPPQSAVLVRAFEADKAVYELVYEARNRPNWLAIPLASLRRLAGPEG